MAALRAQALHLLRNLAAQASAKKPALTGALLVAQALSAILFCLPAAAQKDSAEPGVKISVASDHATASSAPAAIGTASDATKKLIDDMVIYTMDEQQIPALALTIVKDDHIIYQRCFGVCDLESKQPVTPQTIFGVAALSKTFTACSLLSLVDKKQIQLDAPLSKYLDKLADSWKPLTIRQLATMTAGIPSFNELHEKPWPEEFQIAQKQTLLPAGSQYLNSNASYGTLGTVIEKVTGDSYIDALKKTILAPLSMNSTGTLVSLASGVSIVTPYDDEQGRGPLRKIKYFDPEVDYASETLFSNSDDLVKYTSALLHQQLLSKEDYKTMFVDRPPLANGKLVPWAFGWNISADSSYGDRTTISVHGGTRGAAPAILLFPDEHVSVIGLCNLRKPAVAGIIDYAAKIYWRSTNPTQPATGCPVPANE